MLKMFSKKRGFTLVELMVVVVIIGILVAIAVPVYNQTQANARMRACQANLRTLNGACGMYRTNTGAYPAALVNLVPDYIQSVPTCPSSGTYTYAAATGTTTCDAAGHALP